MLSFIADAYLNEMGITNRLRPTEVIKFLTPRRALTISQMNSAWPIDHFAQFVRGTMVPPRDTTLAATPAALARATTFPARLVVMSATWKPLPRLRSARLSMVACSTVPEALGDKVIHPFSDYLLHDIGTGDGIVQVGPQDTANKLRTAPRWGLRMKARLMGDLGVVVFGKCDCPSRG